MLTKGGKLLGVPYTTTASVLYRNLDVLAKAGIDTKTAPSTWAEWLDQMKAVKASGNFAVANQMVEWFQALNYYGGVPGTTFDLKDGVSTLNKAAMAKALTFLKSTQPYAAPVNSLRAGRDSISSPPASSASWCPAHGRFPRSRQQPRRQGLRFDSVPVPGETAGKSRRRL